MFRLNSWHKAASIRPLLAIADKLCKTFGPTFDTDGIPKNFFGGRGGGGFFTMKNHFFYKNLQMTKIAGKIKYLACGRQH